MLDIHGMARAVRASVTCFARGARRAIPLLVVSVFWSSAAFAADPLNSNNRPDEQPAPITAPPDARHPDDEGPRTEVNVVPVLGGSTDLGFGGGYFAGFARVRKGAVPYIWNIDSSGLITFKYSERSGFTSPYQDLYARLTIPRLFGSPLRLEVRPSYTWESIDYFGMGNASSRQNADDNPNPDYSKYQRGHPQFDVDVRVRIVDHLAGRVGFRYIYNAIRVPEDSQLAEDLQNGSAEVKQLIGGTESHSVALFKYGIQFDTRDNETSTHSGTFDTLDLKLSPGGTEAFPYSYAEATLNLRGFVPLGSKRVTLAVRAVGDWMFGNVPFYELARFDDTYALGGTTGVRGVPAQRYYGKRKVLGNLELRLEVAKFRALGKALALGAVPFFDAGRVWADSDAQPELDGQGLGIKYGYGAGLRLQSGSSFVVRLDVAASPDANPVSGYFSAGQMF
ncbi:MAG TPA: BamA/TamA family outer membrane protein [Polyangiaceae bacterium]|nr:BamA/TamA family outer membrane protein [Polyangiaceae bacterium]